MKPSETHDFLVIRYRTAGFFVNRDQFFASIFPDRVRPLDHPTRYLGSAVEFDGRLLPLFDLDALLRDLFGFEDPERLHVALIVDPAPFSAERREGLRAAAERESPPLSTDHLAFLAHGRAEMKRIPLSEIQPLPPCIRSRLRRAGILGCRFLPDEGIWFFLDIERIISPLAFQDASAHENSDH